jgi:hypothetical protein
LLAVGNTFEYVTLAPSQGHGVYGVPIPAAMHPAWSCRTASKGGQLEQALPFQRRAHPDWIFSLIPRANIC